MIICPDRYDELLRGRTDTDLARAAGLSQRAAVYWREKVEKGENFRPRLLETVRTAFCTLLGREVHNEEFQSAPVQFPPAPRVASMLEEGGPAAGCRS